VNPKHPTGPPMTLANMYEQGVRHLIAFCHNDAFRHQVGSTCRNIQMTSK
jgi:hypothetical protein